MVLAWRQTYGERERQQGNEIGRGRLEVGWQSGRTRWTGSLGRLGNIQVAMREYEMRAWT